MKTSITFEIDTDRLEHRPDSDLAVLWHIAQANPADAFKDKSAGQLAEHIGREIIRRFVSRTQPELWNHQGSHFEWGVLHLKKPEAA